MGRIAAAPAPIIVKIVETPHDPTGLSDVLIGSIGLTGAIVLLALVVGLLFGSVLFWLRSRAQTPADRL
jgi:hypothetical protein